MEKFVPEGLDAQCAKCKWGHTEWRHTEWRCDRKDLPVSSAWDTAQPSDAWSNATGRMCEHIISRCAACKQDGHTAAAGQKSSHCGSQGASPQPTQTQHLYLVDEWTGTAEITPPVTQC